MEGVDPEMARHEPVRPGVFVALVLSRAERKPPVEVVEDRLDGRPKRVSDLVLALATGLSV